MTKRKIFYSFHFDNDVMRVQQIRNMGIVEGNAPVSPNAWETAKRTTGGIQRWIADSMSDKSCVVVLVGTSTADRPWVKYEIEKAWNDGKGLLGVFIHNLKDPRTSNWPPNYGKCLQGRNPFDGFHFPNGTSLSRYVKCYNPNSIDPYRDIQQNLSKWIEDAIAARQK